MEVRHRHPRNPYTGEQFAATSAHLTFVALDANKKLAGPALIPETPDENAAMPTPRYGCSTARSFSKDAVNGLPGE